MRVQNNKWHEVWERRTENKAILRSQNSKEIFMELKRINGWDSTGSMLEYDQFYDQYVQTKNELEFSPRSKDNVISSVFEVGCGCGANLYLFQNDGYHVGGMDYSARLIEIASGVLIDPVELICRKAASLPCDIKYDAILSNSVFSYFDSYEYAEKVLEAMYSKANQSIGIIDIHNIEKKEEFIQFRRGLYKDYEERYQDLPKVDVFCFSLIRAVAAAVRIFKLLSSHKESSLSNLIKVRLWRLALVPHSRRFPRCQILRPVQSHRCVPSAIR